MRKKSKNSRSNSLMSKDEIDYFFKKKGPQKMKKFNQANFLNQ